MIGVQLRMRCLGFLHWLLLHGAAVAILALPAGVQGGVGPHIPPPTVGVVLAGSSITWSSGPIASGFSGKVLDFLLNEMAESRLCDEMEYPTGATPFMNSKQYKSLGMEIRGIGARVSFSLFGDEIAICQTILRTKNFAVLEVRADGAPIGLFSNLNPTLGHDSETFRGTGSAVKFRLKHCCTYDHRVTIDGRVLQGAIYSGGWKGAVPEDVDYLVYRTLDGNMRPVHAIWFRKPPAAGTLIRVSYRYGRIISFERSTVGQTTSDEQNESYYGESPENFAVQSPPALVSGLEYRAIDRQAFWIHRFRDARLRHYEIEIVDGANPYFIINFASNRYHNLLNAGIGGWTLRKFLDDDGLHDDTGMFLYFRPDVIVMESATNDDWEFSERKLKRTVHGMSENAVKHLWTLELDRVRYDRKDRTYSVRFCSGIITSIDAFSLICPQVVGSGVRPGDIVRIGTYHGDNRQVTCREIASVDTVRGELRWRQPLSPSEFLNVDSLGDLVGKECSVRDLSGYERRYQNLIDRLRQMAPGVHILLVQPGLANYRMRQLWGYETVHRKLAAKNENVDVIEVTDWLYDFQHHHITGDSSYEIQANGRRVYTLPWSGHWQGFEVWVDGRNVYGEDCYIETGLGYGVNPKGHGEGLVVDRAYDTRYVVKRKMRLVFVKNAPKSGSIRISKADHVWSYDYCHPNRVGASVYGEIYVDQLRKVLR